ncbi:membrane-bound lytic murein transglycosylase B [Polynucleobacter meluiroseus]|uniref:Membrane-bound lytic murein transglycosylase B n=1 Tax=Polynucleobacter meluiroseus TaxID=1938814 RepID=A0A240DYR8_9BURK|nr:lytic murein transglycosylase [Polynucleobacter meluiroseus]SNX28163.1 membrane-bound lytic murein transglycosylase B [Polynucleobacter meluiroseus]
MNFQAFRYLLLLLLALFLSACGSAPTPKNTPNESISSQAEDTSSEVLFYQNLNQLLKQVSQDQGIPLPILEASFLDTKTIPSIRKLVLPPSVTFKKNWTAYRKRFIEPIRIKAGKAFWDENRAYLQQVEQESGVPAEVIVAIIGIETIYGRQLGNFRVKDVLSTLAFSYPDTPNKTSREQLFKKELQELVLLCWSEAGGSLPANNQIQGLNTSYLNACLNQNSSYAGAIGLPQFMPSSIRQYAVDGDGNGRIDLKKSPKDAIASVGSFLKKHGWQPGMPIYFPVQEDSLSATKSLADGEPQLKQTVEDLIQRGILKPAQGDLQAGGVAPQSKALIVDLPYVDQDGIEQVRYLVGLNNFLTIVQYNRSYFYAQSVAEFAEALGFKNVSAVPTLTPASEKPKKLAPPKKKRPT